MFQLRSLFRENILSEDKCRVPHHGDEEPFTRFLYLPNDIPCNQIGILTLNNKDSGGIDIILQNHIVRLQLRRVLKCTQCTVSGLVDT